MHKLPAFIYSFLLIICLLATNSTVAQQGKINGIVSNANTLEPVAYGTAIWMKTHIGTQTDTLGHFSIPLSKDKQDTLIISFVGYKPYKIARKQIETREVLKILLIPTHLSEVFVSSKMTKGYRWWREIVSHKKYNKPKDYDYFYCELYNKYEIDINNIDHYTNLRFLQPFKDKINTIVDSNKNGEKYFPIFFTESVSDFYSSNLLHKTRNEIKALKSTGINNESILEYLEDQDQKTSAYDNFITLFGKEFISPLNYSGNKNYEYIGGDTIINDDGVFYQLRFKPLRNGENVFEGECWVDTSSWAVKKITLTASETADINYIHDIYLEQTYQLIGKDEWVIYKDFLKVKAAPLKKSTLSVLASKTSFQKNIKTDKKFIRKKLENSKGPNVIIHSYNDVTCKKIDVTKLRPEALSQKELQVYEIMDSVKAMPEYKKIRNGFNFFVGGYKKFGIIEIGPWYKWVSGNRLEGLRNRFDISTTEKLNKNFRIHSYIAYGYKDKRFKGGADIRYSFINDLDVFAAYKNDIYNGRQKHIDADIGIDNLFSGMLRRPNIKRKFLYQEQGLLRITKRFPSSFSITPGYSQTHYALLWPTRKGPFDYKIFNTERITNVELSLGLRYAPGEKIIDGFRKDIRLSKGTLPILSLNYAQSLPTLFNTLYEYKKVDASYYQKILIPRWGIVKYTLYAGKVFGDGIPFMMLEVHPGNETFYYNKFSFNLMNRFEYFSDEYAGLNFEHNIGQKVLKYISVFRKIGIRQFYNIKTLWGNANLTNKNLNRADLGEYNIRSLNNGMYTEVGTGFDNIFNVFRIDLVWRLNPKAGDNIPSKPYLNSTKQNFGIFGSFRVQL
ncbi:MAG: DUF5686 family protein [Flavipsychrobacter sp.]